MVFSMVSKNCSSSGVSLRENLSKNEFEYDKRNRLVRSWNFRLTTRKFMRSDLLSYPVKHGSKYTQSGFAFCTQKIYSFQYIFLRVDWIITIFFN